MKNLRCAVVGVGYLGRFHAQKYQKTQGAELVGVCDANPSQAEKIGNELNVPYFSNPRDLLGKVDAVTVAAATQAHYEVCKMFLEAGVHVFVEKPITSTSAQGEELCKLARSKNLKFQVGHIERFNPTYRNLKSKLKSPKMIECRRVAPFKLRGADVSVVHDMMIHDIDLVRDMVSSPIASIKAMGVPVAMPTFDYALVTLTFQNGVVANIIGSRIDNQIERTMKVFEKDGVYKADLGSGIIQWNHKIHDATDASTQVFETQEYTSEKVDALQLETQSFVDAIIHNREPEVTGEESVESLRWVEMIVDAAK